MKKYTEVELVTRMKMGSEGAFKELFFRFQGKVFSYLLRVTRSKETAEELLQDTFIKIWEYKTNIDHTLPFDALLFRITKNLTLNFLRGKTNQLNLEKGYSLTLETDRNYTEDKVFFDDYIRLSEMAIDRLSPQCKLIYKMSRDEGKSYEEIAMALGISKDTVRLQIIKSLKHLKKVFNQYADIPFLGTIILLFV